MEHPVDFHRFTDPGNVFPCRPYHTPRQSMPKPCLMSSNTSNKFIFCVFHTTPFQLNILLYHENQKSTRMFFHELKKCFSFNVFPKCGTSSLISTLNTDFIEHFENLIRRNLLFLFSGLIHHTFALMHHNQAVSIIYRIT